MCLDLKIKKLKELKDKEDNQILKEGIQLKIDALVKQKIVTK